MHMNTHAIAVDLGATNVRVALVSRNGRIVQKIKNKTPNAGKSGRVISDKITEMIDSVMATHPHAHPAGIGISSMGPLDYRRGGPFNSPNIPFPFVPLAGPLQKKFSLPVFLLNDANAAVLGEQHFGAGKNKKNIVYITISTGIGAGVIVNGNLLLGASGNAAEIGHMAVDTAYNLACTCNKGFGHWEGYASGRNIPAFFAAWAKTKRHTIAAMPVEAKNVFDRARKGDANVRDFLDELHRINAHAISNIMVSYDPDLITIGGSVMLSNAPILLAGIKKYIDRYLPMPEIRVTPLGEDVTLLGAAATVLKKI